MPSLAKESEYLDDPADVFDIGDRSGFGFLPMNVLSASVYKELTARGEMTTKKKEIGVGSGFYFLIPLLTSPVDKAYSGASCFPGSSDGERQDLTEGYAAIRSCFGVSAKEI